MDLNKTDAYGSSIQIKRAVKGQQYFSVHGHPHFTVPPLQKITYSAQ
jgi:hypothetical protein